MRFNLAFKGLRGTGQQGEGESYTLRSLPICKPHQIYWSEEMKKNEMGGACSMFVGGESFINGFSG